MLQGKNIVTGYGQLEVLHGCDIQVPEGEITTIIGPNGSGKSTLFNTLNGSLEVWNGSITLHEEDTTNLKPNERVKRGLCTVPQANKVFPKMTVRENLLMGGYTIFPDKEQIQENINQAFEDFPRLAERESQVGEKMSGGEQAMLAIARALVAEPDYLLMDEPSLGLAPDIVDDVFEKIERLNQDRDISFLLVEQNVRTALEVTDRVYVLDMGEIVFEGRTEDFVDEDELIQMYIGSESPNQEGEKI
jgi:branched-chain amino acid transport system ATP-binding protein